jgi:RNA polymerase-binding transcription factor DksA
MSDEDRAQELELKEWERNNRSRQAPVKYSPGDHGYGPAECVNCDEVMPAVRREHGFDLCVACKTISEQVSSRYAR